MNILKKLKMNLINILEKNVNYLIKKYIKKFNNSGFVVKQKDSCVYIEGNNLKIIGMLMFRNDLDILSEVLKINTPNFDCLYILDGSDDLEESKKIVYDSCVCPIEFYTTDSELPDNYKKPVRDGARQFILQKIQEKHKDGWIVLLHSDEIYYDWDLKEKISEIDKEGYDHILVRNVHFFLHESDKNNFQYYKNKSVIEQIKWASFPGFPEHRAFKNKDGLSYNVNIMSCVIPLGLNKLYDSDLPLRHYLYRNPEQMIENAKDRISRGWQNYGQWYLDRNDCFIDVLPNYKYSRKLKDNEKLKNGL